MKSVKTLPGRAGGRLIVFEGISASGKSGNIESCCLYLRKLNFKVKIVQWNNNTCLRSLIVMLHKLGILYTPVYSGLQWIGFFLDYAFKIKPLLEKKYIVLADRYIYTAFTRDFANGMKNRHVLKLYPLFRKPDLVFFHDLDPAECLNRIMHRGKPLFHTNRKLKSKAHLKNRELLYLKMLRREYLRIFGKKHLMQNTRFIHLKGEMQNLPLLLHHYLQYEDIHYGRERPFRFAYHSPGIG